MRSAGEINIQRNHSKFEQIFLKLAGYVMATVGVGGILAICVIAVIT